METTRTLKEKFLKIGATVVIDPDVPRNRMWGDSGKSVTYNKGTFRLTGIPPENIQVLDTNPGIKHLLILVRDEGVTKKTKFLCGHDERDYFVAQVGPTATNVAKAMDSLKPEDVIIAGKRGGVRKKDKNKHTTPAWKRQGEWFFIPVDFVPGKNDLVMKKEPFFRQGSSRHFAEEAVRKSGKAVYLKDGFKVSRVEYMRFLKLRMSGYPVGKLESRIETGEMLVRGKITHKDHTTLVLQGWHRVLLNNEESASVGGVRNTFFD
jgi:hypothetical protein